MTSVIRLAAGPLRVEVAPLAGGALAGFWGVGAGGHRIDWLRAASHEALARRDPLGMASFPLVPFCNRIRQGRASFEGRDIRLAPNRPDRPSPHPLHGIGWQRPWRVQAQDDCRVELVLEEPATAAWPWAFAACQRITLAEDALSVWIEASNRDEVAMPLGLGHHPYFPHRPGTRLTAACAAMWRTDAEVMPTALETGEVVDRLRAGVALSELVLDNNFVGWEHVARIDWPAEPALPARHLLLQADPVLDYFVVYSPAGADHFCAEPVSQCTDWLNLLPRYGHGPLGGARLPPGQTLGAGFRLTPRLEG